jgi:hypothetical protein
MDDCTKKQHTNSRNCTLMKATKYFSIFLLSHTLCSSAIAETVEIDQVPNSIEIVSSTADSYTIELTLGSFEKDGVQIDGEEYFKILLEDGTTIDEKGAPDLPRLSRSISIPANSGVSITIVDSEYVDYQVGVAPSKGTILRNVSPDSVPYTFGPAYEEDQFYPEELVSLSEPYLLRDIRGISLQFSPITYNPVTNTLRIYNKLTIDVNFDGEDNRNAQERVTDTFSKHFVPVYNNHFINIKIDESRIREERADETQMLVISADEFIDEMISFVDHKNSIGLSTVMVPVSEVGTDPAVIKSYIQSYYDANPSLSYILLVGDYAQIPTPMHLGGGSDPSYSLVSGSDNYPDLFIGRFSAETSSQVETMVERTILYETGLKGPWYDRAMGIASDQGENYGDDGEADYVHMRNIRDVLFGWHLTDIGEFYDGSQGGEDLAGNPTPLDIASYLNAGASLINYTGHGSSTSWGTSGFSNADVDNLTNDDQLPFIFSVACVNGNFTNTTSFSEAWLRATNASTGNPVGAIGFYGSTINQAWSPPMEAQDAFNDMLITDSYPSYGALVFSASSAMMDAYGSGDYDVGTDMFLTWTLFGDPSIGTTQSCDTDLPKPKLRYTGSKKHKIDSKKYKRFNLQIKNWESYPNQLFDPAPNLPACENSADSSRTWVEIYDKVTDEVIHTYCDLDSSQALTNLSFSVPKNSIDYYLGKVVYVVIHDRNCGVKYTSNSIWTNPYKRTSDD